MPAIYQEMNFRNTPDTGMRTGIKSLYEYAASIWGEAQRMVDALKAEDLDGPTIQKVKKAFQSIDKWANAGTIEVDDFYNAVRARDSPETEIIIGDIESHLVDWRKKLLYHRIGTMAVRHARFAMWNVQASPMLWNNDQTGAGNGKNILSALKLNLWMEGNDASPTNALMKESPVAVIPYYIEKDDSFANWYFRFNFPISETERLYPKGTRFVIALNVHDFRNPQRDTYISPTVFGQAIDEVAERGHDVLIWGVMPQSKIQDWEHLPFDHRNAMIQRVNTIDGTYIKPI